MFLYKHFCEPPRNSLEPSKKSIWGSRSPVDLVVKWSERGADSAAGRHFQRVAYPPDNAEGITSTQQSIETATAETLRKPLSQSPDFGTTRTTSRLNRLPVRSAPSLSGLPISQHFQSAPISLRRTAARETPLTRVLAAPVTVNTPRIDGWRQSPCNNNDSCSAFARADVCDGGHTRR